MEGENLLPLGLIQEDVAGLPCGLDHQAALGRDQVSGAVRVRRDRPGACLPEQREPVAAGSAAKGPVFSQNCSPNGLFFVQTISNRPSAGDAGIRVQTDAMTGLGDHDGFCEAGFHGFDVNGGLSLCSVREHDQQPGEKRGSDHWASAFGPCPLNTLVMIERKIQSTSFFAQSSVKLPAVVMELLSLFRSVRFPGLAGANACLR